MIIVVVVFGNLGFGSPVVPPVHGKLQGEIDA
jgi:hypothetical protein